MIKNKTWCFSSFFCISDLCKTAKLQFVYKREAEGEKEKSEMEWGWRREEGSWFQRHGEA